MGNNYSSETDGSLEPYNVGRGFSDWVKWKTSFDRIAGKEFAVKPNEVKVKIFLENFRPSSPLPELGGIDKNTIEYDELVSLVNKYFLDRRKLVSKRHKFNNYRRHQNQSLEDLRDALKKLSFECDFGEDEIEDRVRDIFRLSLPHYMQLNLLKDGDITLDQTVQRAKSMELSAQKKREEKRQEYHTLLYETGSESFSHGGLLDSKVPPKNRPCEVRESRQPAGGISMPPPRGFGNQYRGRGFRFSTSNRHYSYQLNKQHSWSDLSNQQVSDGIEDANASTRARWTPNGQAEQGQDVRRTSGIYAQQGVGPPRKNSQPRQNSLPRERPKNQLPQDLPPPYEPPRESNIPLSESIPPNESNIPPRGSNVPSPTHQSSPNTQQPQVINNYNLFNGPLFKLIPGLGNLFS